MEEPLVETVIHRAGEVVLEGYFTKEAILEEIKKVLPNSLGPHLIMVRALLTDGFYPLTPDTGLFVQKFRHSAVNQALAMAF